MIAIPRTEEEIMFAALPFFVALAVSLLVAESVQMRRVTCS